MLSFHVCIVGIIMLDGDIAFDHRLEQVSEKHRQNILNSNYSRMNVCIPKAIPFKFVHSFELPLKTQQCNSRSPNFNIMHDIQVFP